MIYIAGPISGVRDYEERFAACEAWLREHMPGHEIFNPAKLPKGMSAAWSMERCLPEVCRANAVCMLGGFNTDSGALIELMTAEYCDKTVFWFERHGAAEVRNA